MTKVLQYVWWGDVGWGMCVGVSILILITGILEIHVCVITLIREHLKILEVPKN